MICERLETRTCEEYETAVCGGGIGGIAAALASARGGRKTVLFEKGYILGGLATAGLITIYLPLCDGMGNQVSFGIAEELLRLSIKHGYEEDYPENWLDSIGTRTEKDKRFRVQYNPHIFAVLAEKLLIEAGVTIMYGSYIVCAEMDGDRIASVICENKSGRCAYKIKNVIDATGDCDIAKFADAPTDTFKQKNLLAGWYYSLGKNGYKLNSVGAADIPDEDKSEERKKRDEGKKRYEALEGAEISQMVIDSHDMFFSHFLNQREKDPDFIPVTIPTTPQIRMTRKLVGEYILSNKEEHKYFEDSIGMISDWRKRGPAWEVPYRCLYNKKVKNLAVCGRCVSTNEPMWDVMRVIPCCAVTGQAAGTAAALCEDFSALDISILQNELCRNGVVLHFERK